MAETIFWMSILLLIYIYAGYPLLLYVLKVFFRRPVNADQRFEPTVALIISAFNEQDVIEAKIKNSLELNYPPEKLQIWVVSDASTDATDRLVRNFGDERVHLFRLNERRGKTFGITQVMKKIEAEVVVFSDANSIYEPNAIRELVKYFADERVGYVVGYARYYKDEKSAAGAQEDTYWSFEVKMKMNESAIGSVVGGDGAIYAIRRTLFKPLHEDDINDFVNPMQIILQGYRGIFNPRAVCYEEASPSFIKEYWRKRRIVNRSWRGLWKNAQILNPFKTGFYALQIFSHKLLRWLGGFFCLTALVSNAFLLKEGAFYLLTFWAQLLFHLTALLGYALDKRGKKAPFLVNLPYYFDMVNLASLQGIVEALYGKKYVTWKTIRQE